MVHHVKAFGAIANEGRVHAVQQHLVQSAFLPGVLVYLEQPILDGRVPNACLMELFTDHGAGSQIRSTEPRVKPRVKR